MAFGLLIRQPAPRVPAEVRVRLGRSRRRTGPAAGQGLDCLRWQSPFQRPCPRARAGSPRFPGGPSRDSAPVHDPGRPVAPRRWRRFRYCPRPVNTEGVVGLRFRGLPRRFITCCLRFTTGVAARHARLASGWRAAPLPGGSRTRWTATRGFRSCHPPLQGLPWRNNRSSKPWNRPPGGQAGARSKAVHLRARPMWGRRGSRCSPGRIRTARMEHCRRYARGSVARRHAGGAAGRHGGAAQGAEARRVRPSAQR